MNTKTILLTAILTIGFTFQNCHYNCGCPDLLGYFFDIQGIDIIHYKKAENGNNERIQPNEKIEKHKYTSLTIDFLVNYHSLNHKENNEGFSFMNSAQACSCTNNGEGGSETEKIKDLTIITIKDFDEKHLANDTINDLFDIQIYNDTYDLIEYLEEDTALVYIQSLSLFLTKAPSLSEEFLVNVVLSLSTGETYIKKSEPILITN
jgi:hypothetical protein